MMAYTSSRLKLLQNAIDQLTKDEIEGVNDALCCYGEGMMSTKDRNALLEHWIGVCKRNQQFKEWLASLLESLDGPESARALIELSTSNKAAASSKHDDDDTDSSFPSNSYDRQSTVITRNCIAVLLFVVMGIAIIIVSILVIHPHIYELTEVSELTVTVSFNDTVIVGIYQSNDTVLLITNHKTTGNTLNHLLTVPESDLIYRSSISEYSEDGQHTTTNKFLVHILEHEYLLAGSVITNDICIGNASVSGSLNAKLHVYDHENTYGYPISVGGPGHINCVNISYIVLTPSYYSIVLSVPALNGTWYNYSSVVYKRFISYLDYVKNYSSFSVSNETGCSISLASVVLKNLPVAVIAYAEFPVYGENYLDVYVETSTSLHHKVLLFWLFISVGIAVLIISFVALVYLLCRRSSSKRRAGVMYERIPDIVN